MRIFRLPRRIKQYAIKKAAEILLPMPKQLPVSDEVKKILIYGSMGIGNMILFTPTLKAIRRLFSEAHITLMVARPEYGEVIQGSTLVDEIMVVKPSYWNDLRIAEDIRNMHFDLLFSNFQGLFFKRITLFSGIPYRIGHCSSPDWTSDYDDLYNIKVRMKDKEHEIDRNLHLVECFGIKVTDLKPIFFISNKAIAFADEFFYRNKICTHDLTIGIQVGSFRHQGWKHWSINRLAQVCDLLMEKYQARIILLGSSSQREELETLLKFMKKEPIIAVGKTNIKQAAAIIKKCNFTICNDTGLMHVSAAVGTPVIAIYGPTDYTRTSPLKYNKDAIILRKDLPCSPCYRMAGEKTVINCRNRECLNSITVQDVVEAAKKMIAKKNASG